MTSTIGPAIIGTITGTPLGASIAPVPPGCGFAPVPGYVVTVLDAGGAAIPGIPVTLDFFATGARPLTVQNPGTIVVCGPRTLTVMTNACGVAVFAPRIGDFNNGFVVGVSAAGVCLGNNRVTSTDLDGLGGSTGVGDLAIFATNFFGAPAAPETDFDLNGFTGLADLAIFARQYASGVVGVYCP
jgi:hypothetical protein